MIVARRLGFIVVALAVSGAPARAADDPRLIPKPREVAAGDLAPIARSVSITGAANDDDRFAAKDLSDVLRERGVRVTSVAEGAFKIAMLRLDSPTARRVLDENKISFSDAMKGEGYVLLTTKEGAAIVAASSAGMFYGAQTLKQLVRTDGGATRIQLAVIRDWPAMRYRGFHDDLSRGPVPTLEFQKKELRTLAAYKINVYSPYFEHTLAYDANPLISPPGGAMSHDDVRALVAYAKHYHIDVVPEQEAFGHLHHVLKYDLYSSIGEHLPMPFSVTTSRLASRLITTMPISSSRGPSSMPFTPVVSRPITRASCSWNRIDRPCRVARTMSFVPLVTWTSISSSPGSILIALMPLVRGFEYCDSAVFLTVPSLVANSRNWSSGKSRTVTIADTCVSGDTLIMFTMGFPFAARPAWGISWTLSQKHRPSSLNTST